MKGKQFISVGILLALSVGLFTIVHARADQDVRIAPEIQELPSEDIPEEEVIEEEINVEPIYPLAPVEMPQLKLCPVEVIMVEKEEEKPDYLRDDIPLDYETQEQLYAACEEFGIDFELGLAIVKAETQFQNITGDNGNAHGYMQIQPRWHYDRMAELGITTSDLYDPLCNFRVGCHFLNELMGMFSTTREVLAFYNGGIVGNYSYASVVLGYYEEFENDV